MSLALSAVDAAIFARLRTLQHTGTPTASVPFARVVRGWPPINQDLLSLASNTPSLIFVWGRVRPELAAETILGDHEAHATDTWTVLVVADETRTVDDIVGANAPTRPSIHALVDLVLATVHGLPLDGSWHGRRVRVPEYGPNAALSMRGSLYVADVVLAVDRTVPAVVDALAGEPLEEGRGELGPDGAPFNDASIDFDP